jgi:hypothetical protein
MLACFFGHFSSAEATLPETSMLCPLPAGPGAEKIWKLENTARVPRNPLKTLKTAKGIFGKAWRIQGKNLEMLGVDLEMFGAGLEKLALPGVIRRPRRAPARNGR